MIRIRVADFTFMAREETLAPNTCAAFRRLLPFRQKLIQARWSGEAGWIPLGDKDLGVSLENATGHPSRGDILFHPSGTSEAEILLVYGSSRFASKVGPLAGNHFLTIIDRLEDLPRLGRKILWDGAQDIVFEQMPEPASSPAAGST